MQMPAWMHQRQKTSIDPGNLYTGDWYWYK